MAVCLHHIHGEAIDLADWLTNGANYSTLLYFFFNSFFVGCFLIICLYLVASCFYKCNFSCHLKIISQNLYMIEGLVTLLFDVEKIFIPQICDCQCLLAYLSSAFLVKSLDYVAVFIPQICDCQRLLAYLSSAFLVNLLDCVGRDQ